MTFEFENCILWLNASGCIGHVAYSLLFNKKCHTIQAEVICVLIRDELIKQESGTQSNNEMKNEMK